MILEGFKIPSTDVREVEREIQHIKRKLEVKANKLYQKLIAEEAAFLYDNVALHALNQPSEFTFLEWVINEINYKKQLHEKGGIATPYNFQVYVHVLTYKDETYLHVICNNSALMSAFGRLEDVSLNKTESLDEGNAKNKLWRELHKIYENKPQLSLNLTPELYPKKDQIVIPSKQDRINTLARHAVSNHYLRMLSGGQNIPPYLLVPYLDLTMEYLTKEEGKADFMEKVHALQKILPESDAILKHLFPENALETKE